MIDIDGVHRFHADGGRIIEPVKCHLVAVVARPLGLGIVTSDNERQIFADIAAKGQAAGQRFPERIDLDRGSAVDGVERVLPLIVGSGAHAQAIGHAQVQHAGDVDSVKTAVAAIERGRELILGRGADHVDHAGGGVAAIKGALRSTQHFDTLHVIEAAQRIGRARDIDAVHQERGRGIALFRCVGARHTADRNAYGITAFGQREVRHCLRQSPRVCDAGALELIAANRRKCDWRLGQQGRLSQSGDYDVACGSGIAASAICGILRRLASVRRLRKRRSSQRYDRCEAYGADHFH